LFTHLRLGLQSVLFPEGKVPPNPQRTGVKHRIVFVDWHRQ